MKRIVSLFLAAVMLCLSMTACADRSPAALTLGDYKVTEAKYSYWASQAKGNYMYSYEDVQNTDEYWQSEIQEGVTVAEYLDDLTLSSIKTTLVACKLFDEYGLSFTSEEVKNVRDLIDDLIIERAEGSKNMMNTMLGEYGINTKILEEIYLDEAKISKVNDHLYSDGGEMALTDSDYESFYMENYAHFQMIYINNAYQYVTDDEGNRTTDESGYYMTEDMDPETKAEKDAAIASIQERLAQGEDFNVLFEEYSEIKDYENGYYFSAADSYSDMLYYRLCAECESLEVGGYATVESDTGTCIIQKLDLDAGAWADDTNKDFFGEGAADFKQLVQETAFRELLESYFDDITVAEDIIKKYSVATVTPAYFF